MASFLLEVGTEELPAGFVVDAIAQWQERIPSSLGEADLSYGAIRVMGTPRRLAVLIEDLPTEQVDRVVAVKGPAVTAAFANGDPQGQPTKAAEGFARSRGVAVSDLYLQQTEKGAFVFAQQFIPGRKTADLLTELAPQWILSLEGKRLMRWGDGEMRFSRPIRWLVALWDSAVLPIEIEGLRGDRQTWGHRVLHPRPVTLTAASTYVTQLRDAKVIVDGEERRRLIVTQMAGLAELMESQPEVPESLLEEVTYLVEYPTAVVGEFEREFLRLPTAVIKTEMVSHQRYFPLYARGQRDRLVPYFITISNGNPEKSKLIAAGNGRVIRARLADGQFFYEADRQRPLADFLPVLAKVTFQEQLGSLAERVQRLRAIAPKIVEAIPNLRLSTADLGDLDRAAELCKADLVSQMVKEFPELQGIMGEDYARNSGEADAVAVAIREHYQPRSASDSLPSTPLGRILAIAERLDSLVGILGLGIQPTGSSDPFALRRAATGVLQIAWDSTYDLNLTQLLPQVADCFGDMLTESRPTLLSNLQRWFRQRCETLLLDRAVDYDLVDAVLGVDDPDYLASGLATVCQLRDRALFLQHCRQNGTLGSIYEVINRASRLAIQGEEVPTLDVRALLPRDRLQDPAEQGLYDALAQMPPQPTHGQLFTAIQQLTPLLNTFFESVLVMAEDPQVRRDRLVLLGIIRRYSRLLADFGCIRGQ
ncbi:MAG: glycine--tRNA ligase subunit beta [Oscillatoriales cyanobacterium SM2_2_1]|nr:glycine--tRNA ligase subunit beta [Oscillatoriales cyanobacterium SM2_2_1]